ncbi:hypothetical protein [Pseudoflavonifractor sp. An44]|uniref:hypothetical protein n=1 Tax=Pseudoflavonifractor sp. An44 TaxID=1965635 RepID=UPI00117BDAE2|nr:hypothetical protein [Pseudoflavonifractor sp. An44]
MADKDKVAHIPNLSFFVSSLALSMVTSYKECVYGTTEVCHILPMTNVISLASFGQGFPFCANTPDSFWTK